MNIDVEIVYMGPALSFELPFDPKEAFGKVRAPVRVTINGFELRTTVAATSGKQLIGLNKQVRAGASVAPGDRVGVAIVLDEEPRTVEVLEDLAAALDADARAFLDSLSYTHRKDYVRWIEEAKRAETRQARFAKAAVMLAERVRHP